MRLAGFPGAKVWRFPAEDARPLPLEDLARDRFWNLERKKAGKKPWQWIELEVDRCSHTYGQAPCTASGAAAEKCFNSWATCQDQANFSAEPFWIRLSDARSDLPRSFQFADPGLAAFVPLLKGVEHVPQSPDPGESLGIRVQLSVNVEDAPHHDRGIDKYVAERDYDPMERSTFFRKLRTRFPHYIGRRLRWYQGYITDSPHYADFRRREYVMERFDGPDAKGLSRIVAKDPLKLLDDERAQAPRKSQGTLLAALLAASSPATLDIVTSDTTEYDLIAGESVDYVRIGKEVMQYTGTSVVGGNVRLSGLTYSAPSPYTTEREDHDAGDEVQRCRFFSGTIAEVLRELMVDYGEMDEGYIPFEDWQLEADTWVAGDDIQRLVTEPEGVKALIEEIIQQTLTWGIWFDEIDQEIRYRAVRPADYTEMVATLGDDASLVADSIKISDDPDRLLNEIQVLYGQIDPTVAESEVGNYRKGLLEIDSDSQSANELGQRRLKRVFGRWHPATNTSVLERFVRRTLTSRSSSVMTVEFRVERKDENLRTADFADLTTMYLIDQFGAQRTTRVQVLRVHAAGEQVTYKAREDFFAQRLYGRWAPVELTGLSWLDATDEQRLRYLFWADADGKFSNGDDGKIWL